MWALWIMLVLSVAAGWPDKDFLVDVVRETKSSLLLIRYDHCPEHWLQRLLVTPPLPLVLQSLSRATSTPPSRHLQLICLQSAEYPAEHLTQLLEHAHGEARSIFYIVDGVSNFSSHRVLHSLLRQSYQLRRLNVIAVLAGDAARVYYRYRPYPRFQLEQRSLAQRPFFATDLGNMQGQPLIVLPDQSHPRIIIYTNWRNGAQVLAGSVGRFVRTLAWKLNATIRFPIEIGPGTGLHFKELLSLVEQHRVDLPASVVQLLQPEQLPVASFPLELSHICLMIPLAQQLPIRNIYLILFSVYPILIGLAIVYGIGMLLCLQKLLVGEVPGLVDFLLNDVALRGLLGQSFGRSLRTSISFSWLYLMLAVLGLNLSSIHEAALGTLLTQPPKHFQPRSFADVRRAELPLAAVAADVESLHDWGDPDLRVVPFNSSDYNRQRDSMNMSHVYYASRLKWTLLSEQQKYFPREVFLYSKEACARTLTYMVFQLPKHSWFLELINRLILDVRASGLYQHWVNMHFYDMAAAGLLSFRDPIKRKPQRTKDALHLEDLQWVWIAYVALLLLSAFVLALEIIVQRLQQRLRRL